MLVAISLSGGAHAEGDRSQEQLRRLKMQLRQVQQDQEAAVQEARAKADADKAAMSQTLKSAQGEAAAQRATAGAASRRLRVLTEELDSLKKDKADLSAQLLQIKQALEESKAKAAEQQNQSGQTIASWHGRHKQLSEVNDQCRTDNAALYLMGSELLSKYENKGLGDILASKEPFIQTARVTLENTKAQYQDKLDAARLKVAAP
ncbi:hypothetical protein [Aquabacterium sp.]|uniref:hypothetical protein n=1 Tax=Aquabacterium sp. TaxID=1872578 RepID=UPI0040380C14